MQAPLGEAGSVSRRRLLAIYGLLAVVVVVGATLSIAAGEDEQAQPAIAGGYDVTGANSCLGRSFDLVQSGQFVNVDSAAGGLSGKLRLHGQSLNGTVSCVDGREAHLQSKVAADRLTGTIGGQPVSAEMVRDPPAPGSRHESAPSAVDGAYKLAPSSACFGGAIKLQGPSDQLRLKAGDASLGVVRYDGGPLSGTVGCIHGGQVRLSGEAAGRALDLTLAPVAAAGTSPASPPVAEHIEADKTRDPAQTLAVFFVAVAVVMLTARLLGAVATRVAQPRVMGEVIGGIVLGPSVFGALFPDLQVLIFPQDIIPIIGVVANLGLIFYMFLVGMELDLSQLKGRITQAAVISNASVAFPLILGMAAAVPIYRLVAPDQEFVAFALFMGVAMSITAFPVLARILVERRMLTRPVGALTMAAAAIDDVTAWFLIALALAVAVAGTATGVIKTVVLAAAFCAVMFLAVRPLLARISQAYDEVGRVPTGWIVAIFAGVLLSAYTTETIGIAVIFGAFLMGMIMPRHAGLTEDVTGRIEDFVITLLLPLFFAYTGLRTNVGLLDRPELWVITGALLVIAIAGKLLGAMLVSRATGFNWNASAVIGTLMNTRGLTELIVLNIALEKGVISESLFAALVIMALATTLMAGPLLRLLDPKNEYGAPLGEELDRAKRESEAERPTLPIPERSILLAPRSDTGLPQLLALGEPLAVAEPPRELILARLVNPPRAAAAGVRGGLQTENMLLREATAEVQAARDELLERGIAARSVAFISSDPKTDLSRVAAREGVDLALTEGRRPLLGEGVPKGPVGALLEQAPCDVGVLVAREGAPIRPGPDTPILVPFGGAEHDWAALELGAWLASATEAPLRLVGAAAGGDDHARLSRMLADAALLVQSYANVSAEPLIASPGPGIVDATSGAALLVVGLSPRWRQEGLGPVRSEIARTAPAPVLFVRRGTRPGALAPEEDLTRFTWSTPGMATAAR